MWGISYIITALVAPNIALDTPPIFYATLGLIILIGVISKFLIHGKIADWAISIYFIALAVIMVYGGVLSFAGIGLWNVPFPNKEGFQISMAFMDFLSAFFMVAISFDKL